MRTTREEIHRYCTCVILFKFQTLCFGALFCSFAWKVVLMEASSMQISIFLNGTFNREIYTN